MGVDKASIIGETGVTRPLGSARSLDGAIRATCERVAFARRRWPADSDGHHGSLHAKCAVADQQKPLISSANLTDYAMTLNLELGLMVTGGPLPGRIVERFDRLIGDGVLARVG